MFIRPVGTTVHAATRPAGRPLLRGLLVRAAGAEAGAADTEAGAADAAATADAQPQGLLGRAVRAAQGTGRVEWEPEPEPEPGPWPDGEGEAEPDPDREGEAELWPPDPASPEEPPRSAPAHPEGLVSDLTRLAALVREGLLTPEEFTAAKARLLRG